MTTTEMTTETQGLEERLINAEDDLDHLRSVLSIAASLFTRDLLTRVSTTETCTEKQQESVEARLARLEAENQELVLLLRATIGAVDDGGLQGAPHLETGTTVQAPRELVARSKEILAEALKVAEAVNGWLRDVAALEGAVALLVPRVHDEDLEYQRWASACHLDLLFQMAVWLAEQQQKVTGSVGGRDFSVLELRSMVEEALAES